MVSRSLLVVVRFEMKSRGRCRNRDPNATIGSLQARSGRASVASSTAREESVATKSGVASRVSQEPNQSVLLST